MSQLSSSIFRTQIIPDKVDHKNVRRRISPTESFKHRIAKASPSLSTVIESPGEERNHSFTSSTPIQRGQETPPFGYTSGEASESSEPSEYFLAEQAPWNLHFVELDRQQGQGTNLWPSSLSFQRAEAFQGEQENTLSITYPDSTVEITGNQNMAHGGGNRGNDTERSRLPVPDNCWNEIQRVNAYIDEMDFDTVDRNLVRQMRDQMDRQRMVYETAILRITETGAATDDPGIVQVVPPTPRPQVEQRPQSSVALVQPGDDPRRTFPMMVATQNPPPAEPSVRPRPKIVPTVNYPVQQPRNASELMQQLFPHLTPIPGTGSRHLSTPKPRGENTATVEDADDYYYPVGGGQRFRTGDNGPPPPPVVHNMAKPPPRAAPNASAQPQARENVPPRPANEIPRGPQGPNRGNTGSNVPGPNPGANQPGPTGNIRGQPRDDNRGNAGNYGQNYAGGDVRGYPRDNARDNAQGTARGNNRQSPGDQQHPPPRDDHRPSPRDRAPDGHPSSSDSDTDHPAGASNRGVNDRRNLLHTQSTQSTSAADIAAALTMARGYREPRVSPPLFTEDIHFDNWVELMDKYLALWNIPADVEKRKIWEGIPQDRQRIIIQEFRGNDDVMLCQDANEMLAKLRTLFVPKTTRMQHVHFLRQNPQRPGEKTEDYISRKSREIFARLPLQDFPIDEHCNLIALGIRNFGLQRNLLREAQKTSITVAKLKQRANAEEALNAQLDIEKQIREVSRNHATTNTRGLLRRPYGTNPPRPNQPGDQVRAVATSDARPPEQKAMEWKPRQRGICWHCNEPGHIRPKCEKYLKWLKSNGKTDRQITQMVLQDYEELDAEEEGNDLNCLPPGLTSTGERETEEVETFQAELEDENQNCLKEVQYYQ